MVRAVIFAFVLTVGCGSSTTPEIVGEVGWSFDYRDWTRAECPCFGLAQDLCTTTSGCSWSAGAACEDITPGDCTVPDVRTCTNEPVDRGNAPPYDPVATVLIQIEDPDTGITTFDFSADCTLGDSDLFFGLRGQSRKLLRLRLFGFDADGVLTYEPPQPWDLDLTTPIQERFVLRTPSGELRMDVIHPATGVGQCPSYTDGSGNTVTDVASLDYVLTPVGAVDPALTGTMNPACDPPDIFGNIAANRLVIRNIPAKPAGGVGSVQYDLVVRAKDSGGTTLSCGTQQRPVNPGLNRLITSLTLSPGECL